MKVKIINKSNNELPAYSTKSAAGMDVRASFSINKKEEFYQFADWDEEGGYLIIFPGGRALIPTDLYLEIPDGYEIQVRPRSGLALKEGITVLNTPGTLDSDYRGNVGVILMNLGDDPFIVKEGDRIAQIVMNKVENIEWDLSDSLSESERASGGFGHTGKQ